MTAPQPGQSVSTAAQRAPDVGKQVLRFSDGSQALANPDLYLPKGLAARISHDSDLSNTIIEAFVVSVATAMTVAATKSAAQTRT